ncbi:MAG: hypothetical protein UY58_C0004G0016 [Candidatus Magasanikbacteria bacterium GW2011_GWA2_50_22]|uniref:S-layer domain-containing protein n=1 Tax=Candidatus Magasanikbacteria bacterium GW2011_GWA2_50_22 TaxID=1619043 RepID=A0A0G1YQU9_9BACT|nr:MAG: hypothetical protein UY58_C0004G0016 [Candidatus Magasanikbacteria bacterium GW2011_GWA2_50_22]
MFEETIPPSNLPISEAPSAIPPVVPNTPAEQEKEPEDMFAGVEPKVAPSPPPAEGGPAEIKEPLIGSRKVIIIGGIVLGVLVITGVVYGGLSFLRRAAAPPLKPVAMPEVMALPEVSTETPAPPQIELPEAALPSPAQVAPPLDTDGDGLSDDKERSLGTDPGSPDSDTDGLFDREEVETYQTDPRNPDTDGDGYLDGQEVRNGYNPGGEGRLFSVPGQ